ncbi:MAG: hypothetical protein IJ091_03335 [Oscillospiraceae bacterium]|nr:hypothetical protein [Oscillospiraceae bacterium]
MKRTLPRNIVNLISGVLILLGILIIQAGSYFGLGVLQWVGLIVLASFLPFRYAFLRCPYCHHYLDTKGRGNSCPWCGKELP